MSQLKEQYPYPLEHRGIPPTCECKDYGVHRALRRLRYEQVAGRIEASMGGQAAIEYEQRVAFAASALEDARMAAGQPGRINPTPGYLLGRVRQLQAELRAAAQPHLTRIQLLYKALIGLVYHKDR